MLANEAEARISEAGWRSNLAPFRDRFLDWWNGHASSEASQDNSDALMSEADQSAVQEPPWSRARLQTMEMIWGEGFMVPGGERYARKLLAVLALSSKKSVLDLTAGIGGTARTMSNQHNLWMDAFEPIEALAIEGQRRSAAEGLSKRVPITTIDIQSFELTPHRYDAIYSRERLFTLANKEHIIDQCVRGLKEKGQILFTDLVETGPGSGSACDPAILHIGEEHWFWTLDQYREVLESHGFLIYLANDLTEEYLDHIHGAWSRALQPLHEQHLSARLQDLVVDECETWLARWQALKDGHLAFIRIHAHINPAE